MSRITMSLSALFLSVLIAGCTNPASQREILPSAATQKTEVHTISAEYYCKDGKVGIRLIGSSGIKEVDETILKFLADISDAYPNLKEGETMPYPEEKLKLLEGTVTGK